MNLSTDHYKADSHWQSGLMLQTSMPMCVSSATMSLQLRTVLQSCRSIRKVQKHLIPANVVFVAFDTRRLLDRERRDDEQRLHKESQEAVAWLSHLNFSSRQIDVFSQQQEGTGSWFLNMDAFKRWLDGNERMLWCPGLREILLWNSTILFVPLLTIHKPGLVKQYLRMCNRYSVRS